MFSKPRTGNPEDPSRKTLPMVPPTTNGDKMMPFRMSSNLFSNVEKPQFGQPAELAKNGDFFNTQASGFFNTKHDFNEKKLSGCQNRNYFEECLGLENLSILSQKPISKSQNKSENVKEIDAQTLKEIIKQIVQFKETKEAEIIKLTIELEDFKACVKELKAENETVIKENKEIVNENAKLKANAEKLSEVKNLQFRCDFLMKELECLIKVVDKNTEEVDEMRQINEYFNQEKIHLEYQVEYYKNNFLTLKEKYGQEVQQLKEQLGSKEQELADIHQKQFEKMKAEEEETLKKLELVKKEYMKKVEELRDSLQGEQEKGIQFKKQVETLRVQNEDFINQIIEQIEKLQDNVTSNFTTKIGQMKEKLEELESKLAALQETLTAQNEMVVDLNQALNSEQAKNEKMTQECFKLETENSNLTHDIKKLYFTVKNLRVSISNIETEKNFLMSEREKDKETMKQSNDQLQRIQNEKEELIKKIHAADESKVVINKLTEKFTSLVESKDNQYQNIIQEKEKLIEDLKKQNSENMEKIRLVQMEKDKLFRNFHELVLNSFKQPSAAISSVAPIRAKVVTDSLVEDQSLVADKNRVDQHQNDEKGNNPEPSPIKPPIATATVVPPTPSPPKPIDPVSPSVVAKSSPIVTKRESILRTTKRKITFEDHQPKKNGRKTVSFLEVFPSVKEQNAIDANDGKTTGGTALPRYSRTNRRAKEIAGRQTTAELDGQSKSVNELTTKLADVTSEWSDELFGF